MACMIFANTCTYKTCKVYIYIDPISLYYASASTLCIFQACIGHFTLGTSVPPPPPTPHGGTLVPRVGQLCLGINVPCGHICLGIIVQGQWCVGTSVRGTAMPRHECLGGHFAGGTTMPTTPGWVGGSCSGG